MLCYEDKNFIFDKPRSGGLTKRIKEALNFIDNIYYSFIFNSINVKRTGNEKYIFSICSIFKDEAPYLKEWIEYHLIVGVDHFYMYNNFSSDNYLEVLSPYIEKGIVTLKNWPVKQGQISAYEDFIKEKSKETKWVGFIDIDEFIVPNEMDNIKDFLAKFENRPTVLLYWKMFGTSGLINRKTGNLVTEDFTVCWEKYSDVSKVLFNTKFVYDRSIDGNDALHHFMKCRFKNTILPPVNVYNKVCSHLENPMRCEKLPVHLNHYFTKSYNEYVTKKSKGDVFFEINPHDEEYFYEHEMKCKDVDYSIYKYLIKLKKAMNVEK